MFLSKEAFLASIQARVGNDTSEEAITFIEDFTDTYNELEQRTADQTDWKQKYEENDNSWREKYKERFFSAADTIKEEELKGLEKDSERKTFSDLFTEREG